MLLKLIRYYLFLCFVELIFLRINIRMEMIEWQDTKHNIWHKAAEMAQGVKVLVANSSVRHKTQKA